ncbi:MAG: TlpA family protein disulfide reductase [Stellaceae bacterium]
MRSGCSVLAALLLLAVGSAAHAGPPAAGPADPPLGVFVPAPAPRPAPDITFADAAGHQLTLSDFAGKIVLVNLWATWCAPCRSEMPSLERLQTRFGDKLTVLAISEDIGGEKAVAPFVEKLGLKAVKTYLDPKSMVAQAFKVDGLPTSFLIDREGRVLGHVVGEAKWDSPKLLAVIAPLLDENGVVKISAPSARP